MTLIVGNSKNTPAGDLTGVIYDAVEVLGLPYNGGSGAPAAVQPAASYRIGGIDAMTSLGSVAFWQPDGLGGIYGAWPSNTQQQLQGGFASVNPWLEPGRMLRHYGMPVPLGWRPSLIAGGMAALPYNYQAEIETVVLKGGTAGAAGTFLFGFENVNASSMFLNPAGAVGFGVFASDPQTTMTLLYLRSDAAAGPTAFNLPLNSVVPVTAAAVRLKWRITWGTIWLAELFYNGSLVASFSDADVNWANLNNITATSGLIMYPVMYTGSNTIRHYYSRATVRLVTP